MYLNGDLRYIGRNEVTFMFIILDFLRISTNRPGRQSCSVVANQRRWFVKILHWYFLLPKNGTGSMSRSIFKRNWLGFKTKERQKKKSRTFQFDSFGKKSMKNSGIWKRALWSQKILSRSSLGFSISVLSRLKWLRSF